MVRRIVAEFDAVTGPFLAKMDRIDRSINQFERKSLRSFNRVESGVNSLVLGAGRLRTTLGLIGTGFGVNLATRFVDEIALIRNALREAGDTSEETFQRVFQASTATLTGFRATATAVQRFQRATLGEQDIERTIRQVETLNRLFALSGRTTQERQSTQIQFSQALQAGYLGGEELRAVRENAPIDLVRAIAREAGGTIEELKDLSAQGLLTRDVMIRALESLEEEAIDRFGNIQVTIQDAATVMANGALVATEGFDRGLGLSRATVTGLRQVGEILGENAQAAEMFGEAIKVAGGAFALSFAGRTINRGISGLQGMTAARLADARAADAQVVANAREVASRRAAVLSAERHLATVVGQNRAASTQAQAQKRLTSANASLRRSQDNLRQSSVLAAQAQTNLALRTRSAAAAGALMRGAFSFLGGWPGLLLITGAAFVGLRHRMAAAREEQEALTDVADDYVDAIGRIAEARNEIQRLNASVLGGDAGGINGLIQQQQEAIQRERQALEDARREEQRAQQQRLIHLESERRSLETLEAGPRRQLERMQAEFQAIQERIEAGFLSPETGQRVLDAYQEQMNDLREQMTLGSDAIRDQREVVQRWEQAIDAGRTALRSMGAALLSFNNATGGSTAELETAILRADEILSDHVTETERMNDAVEEAKRVRDQLAGAMGEEADIVLRLNDAIAAMEAEMADARNEASGLTDAVNDLNRAMGSLSGIRLDLTTQLRTVRTQIAAARAGVDQATVDAMGSDAEIARRAFEAGFSPRGIDAQVQAARELRVQLTNAQSELADLFDTGGGGSSDAEDTLEEMTTAAERFIESMMTAEERQAHQLREITQLRQRLVELLGEEAALVQQLDVAIARSRDTAEIAKVSMEDLFSTLSDEIGNNIEEWRGWNHFVRSMIASVVRQAGPSFLMAMFRGQNPFSIFNGFGTVAASVNHDGRGNSKRDVSPLMFLGAPRFHNGLMGDEYPAILQRGEKVIPKNLARAGGSGMTTEHNYYDFRGVDPSMRSWIMQQFDQRDRMFESRWIQTARTVRNKRITT